MCIAVASWDLKLAFFGFFLLINGNVDIDSRHTGVRLVVHPMDMPSVLVVLTRVTWATRWSLYDTTGKS